MKLKTRVANFCAKYSVAKYNPYRPLRVMFRAMYRGMGALSIRFTPSGRKLDYPWPYADPDFPGFPEDEDALVTDPADFVVKRSTSYMAWCIYCYTGRWPRRRAYEGKRYDAKDWGEFLELNGFRSLKGKRPWIDHAMPFLDAYIGITTYAQPTPVLNLWLAGLRKMIQMLSGMDNVGTIFSKSDLTCENLSTIRACLAVS